MFVYFFLFLLWRSRNTDTDTDTDENEGITCLYCHDAMVSGEFSSGKKWRSHVWKLDFLK